MNQQIYDFVSVVWEYYGNEGRHDLPWRQPGKDGVFDPYAIMVSEIMLQQTQVKRAIIKYDEFLNTFPTIFSLSEAPLASVLKTWSGLGYNRRAKFLWQAAQDIQAKGTFPQATDLLVQLPGIGSNTAGAIAVYAFNRPVSFIETNIRTVFIHHFFEDHDDITDKQLMPLIEEALTEALERGLSPREWYWALMDYGTHIKQTIGNASRHSKTYTKQSKFEGSRRQIRGHVLRVLGQRPHRLTELQQLINDERLSDVLQALENESFISFNDEHYHLGSA
jgi:A/G-specific adenine glycosylase